MSDDIETVQSFLNFAATDSTVEAWRRLKDRLHAAEDDLDKHYVLNRDLVVRLHAAEEEIGTLFGDAALIERIRVLEAELDRLREALERIAEIDRRGVAQHDLVGMLAIARAALTQEQHASQTKD